MKIEAIKSRVNRAEPGKDVGPFEIDIGYIRRDTTFQVRAALDDQNVSRLKGAYKAGTELPPVTLAFVVGEEERGPVIVDGHHRIAALEIIAVEQQRGGRGTQQMVKAIFVRLGAEEARWQAAQANMGHGKPLTNKEIRRGFKRYVEAGHHRNVDGTYKSYRAIGAEFGKTHPTVRTWMVKDFPNEAARIKDDDKVENVGGKGVPPPVRVLHHDALNAMTKISTIFDAAYSHERADIIDNLGNLLADLKRTHERTDGFDHDEVIRDATGGEVGVDAQF